MLEILKKLNTEKMLDFTYSHFQQSFKQELNQQLFFQIQLQNQFSLFAIQAEQLEIQKELWSVITLY